MTQRRIVGFAALVAALSITSNAQAAMVTMRATGVVTFVDTDSGLLPGSISGAAIGDAFVLEYTFDDTATDQDSSTSSGYYVFGPSFSMRVSIGSGSYLISSAEPGAIRVANDDSLSGEAYRVAHGSAFDLTGLASLDLETPFSQGSIPPFSSDSLPTTSIDPMDFKTRRMQLQFSRIVPGSVAINDAVGGQLNSVERVGDVPLPAAAWLLLSGLGGLGVMARRRLSARRSLATDGRVT